MRRKILAGGFIVAATLAWLVLGGSEETKRAQQISAPRARLSAPAHRPPSLIPPSPKAPLAARGSPITLPKLAYFADTRVPLSAREAALWGLARRRDAAAIRLLLQLSDQPVYLRWAATAALGRVTTPRFRPELRRKLIAKLDDNDSRTAEAAMRSIGNLLEGDAVDVIAAAMQRAHQRPDGLGTLVCGAGVDTLAKIATPAAARALGLELVRAGDLGGWDYEYGSRVVRALARVGGEESRRALLRYADHLETRLPSGPVARAYVQAKVAEARQAALGRSS